MPSQVVAQSASEDLGRPKAVVEYDIQSGEAPRSVLERMIAAAKQAGFEPREPIQSSDGFFTAVRKESPPVEHRTVVWLDWRYNAPERTLGVYLDYAKFWKPRGSAWQREAVTIQERSDAIADLVRSLFVAARLRR